MHCIYLHFYLLFISFCLFLPSTVCRRDSLHIFNSSAVSSLVFTHYNSVLLLLLHSFASWAECLYACFFVFFVYTQLQRALSFISLHIIWRIWVVRLKAHFKRYLHTFTSKCPHNNHAAQNISRVNQFYQYTHTHTYIYVYMYVCVEVKYNKCRFETATHTLNSFLCFVAQHEGRKLYFAMCCLLLCVAFNLIKRAASVCVHICIYGYLWVNFLYAYVCMYILVGLFICCSLRLANFWGRN